MTIYFLFGDDSYRLQKRLQEIKSGANTGNFGVSQIDASENWDINRFENELTAIGFFGGERLVIVKNLLASKDVDVDGVIKLLDIIVRDSSESRTKNRNSSHLITDSNNSEIASSLAMTNDSVTVVVVENKTPDKRGKLYKWLKKNARSEEVLKLAGSVWNKFASGIIASRNIKITPSARTLLITETEGDSWQLTNVLDQLEAWSAHRSLPIDNNDINLFVSRKSHGDSFKLLDAIARGNVNIALHHIADLWSQGEAPLRVLGAIVFQYRQLVVIKSALDDNINPYEIAKECKIHPFVASKLTPLARNTDWDKLKTIYNEIAKIDEAIKSGKIEPEAGLEILVYNLINLHKKQGELIRIK